MNVYKNILRYTIVLSLIGAICSFVVTFARNKSDPIIAQRAQEQLDYAMNVTLAQFYDNIVAYEESNIRLEDPTLLNLYKVSLDNASTLYVYNASNTGKNGAIGFLIVINEEGYIEHIVYVSHSETPGRGDRIEGEAFLSQIVGKNKETLEIDTISGATISTNAVRTAIEAALENFASEVIV